MSTKRNILFSSVAAVFIGLIIILTPTLFTINQLGYTNELIDRSGEMSVPHAEPKAQSNQFSEDIQDNLFIAEIDPHSSYGSHQTSLLHDSYGTPVFAVSQGDILTVTIVVTSLSDKILQISLEHISGLPPEITAQLTPTSITLQPYEQKQVQLEVTISQTAPISTPKVIHKQPMTTLTDSDTPALETPFSTQIMNSEQEIIYGDHIQLTLRTNDNIVNLGFFLHII